MTLKSVTITLDGATHTVELSDAAAILVGQLQKRLEVADAKVVTFDKLTSDLSTANGKIAALEQQIKDAAMTPAKLDQAVRDRAAVIDTAKKIAPALVADGKTDAEIRREAVKAKLGDAATSMDDSAISGAFAAYASAATTTDTMADGLRGLNPQQTTDGATKVRDAHAEMVANLTNPNATKAA